MTTARIGIRYFGRMTREHALLLTCACAAILFLIIPAHNTRWAPFASSGENTRNETEIDAALQEAAITALGEREGTILVIDPQSGRVRAVVNPQLAFTQALMPGSTMKPFTALAALRAGLINQDSRTVCPGRFTGLGFSLPCVHDDHLPPFTPTLFRSVSVLGSLPAPAKTRKSREQRGLARAEIAREFVLRKTITLLSKAIVTRAKPSGKAIKSWSRLYSCSLLMPRW